MVQPRAAPDLSKLAGIPTATPSPDQGMARFVTAALLEAAKGTCDCPSCQLLRRVTESMTQELLKE